MNKLVNDVTEDAICREKVIVIAGYNRCICVFRNERMENRCYGIMLPVKGEGQAYDIADRRPMAGTESESFTN